MNLETKLADIKGVGPKTATQFEDAGLVTVRNLLEFFPRRYENFSHAESIADLRPGEVVIRGHIDSVSTRFVRRNMRITTAVISDDSGSVVAVWFNQSFREKNLKRFAGTGQEFLFSGEFKLSANRYQLSNPAVEKVDVKRNFFAQNFIDEGADSAEKITPMYPQRHGLRSATIRKILRELQPFIAMLAEDLPTDIIAKEKLISRAAAINEIHFPTNDERLAAAKQRLAFNELFSLMLAARMNRNTQQKLPGFTMKFDAQQFREIVASLPFKLTDAQRRATWEIIQDFTRKSKQENITKIAVFDSGRGGELVSERLRKMFPSIKFDDFNDHENLPYGSKTSTEIRQYVDKKIEQIVAQNYPIVIIACNTATTAAIDFLRAKYKNTFFIGFEPAIKPAAKYSKTSRVMILATPATLASERYKKLRVEFAQNVQIFEPDVSDWAQKIESGTLSGTDLAPIIKLAKSKNIDAVVLGCTHYLAVEDNLNKALPNAKIIQPISAVAKILSRHISGVSPKTPPMNRLLQGDVGSGKTIVAGLASFVAAKNHFQTALMAPTEILAAQHAQTLATLLEPFEISVALLTGSVKGPARKNLLTQLANGKIDLLIGTHALFQPAVKFANLGFAIIDEQHRFGVQQRQALLSKTHNDFLPHLLTMTATPIPRSLQLTVFGDLAISILDQLPNGRKPIKTQIVSPLSRGTMNEQIRTELTDGRQAYFIAPAIENYDDSKENVVNLANKEEREFKNTGAKVGILHGKMDGESKEKIMRDFAQNKLQILVATTVVEVGVDVPNASVMVIENADTFGLAQLHQLRGRVGRGDRQSYCFLVQSDTKPPTRRLREVEKSTDGFYLAEIDLELRGAGEIYGVAQHGALDLRIANLADAAMIKRVASAVDDFVARNDDLQQYPELAHQVAKYQKLTTLN